jgi:hypothetical protein
MIKLYRYIDHCEDEHITRNRIYLAIEQGIYIRVLENNGKFFTWSDESVDEIL